MELAERLQEHSSHVQPSDAFEPELTVIMPCLNEVRTLATCIRKALRTMREHEIDGEVIVADNGSTDGSIEAAQALGVRVIHVAKRGYGSALRAGIANASGRYIVMGDADDSYDFSHIPRFVEKLREGYELVMGNRFQGGVLPGAMPPLHRYLGNPVLSGIGRLLFQSPCGDFHCGLRGFSKRAIRRLELRTTGMEFASEMVVKATIHGLKICEVPTTLAPDGRDRPPHLRSWRDGWRHLRFMLLFSPRWLFFYPGILLMIVGCLVGSWLLPAPRTVFGVTLDVHTLVFAAAAVLVGFQAVLFSLLGKVFAINTGLAPYTETWKRIFRVLTLEKGLCVGAGIFLVGQVGAILSVFIWGDLAFGALNPVQMLRLVVPVATTLVLGCQIILASFFFSLLGTIRDERD